LYVRLTGSFARSAALLLCVASCANPRIEAAPPQKSAPVPAIATASPEATATPRPEAPAMPGPPADAERARVARVVDGDTVVLTGISLGDVDARTGGRRARLIGIDTPEVHGGVECLGREASAFTHRVLDGADVLVDFDVDTIDRYQRALVYIWQADGTFFNGRIVAEGLASPYTVPPNARYADLFVRLARHAREANRGLWARC
jgi:micrococcal nuclease